VDACECEIHQHIVQFELQVHGKGYQHFQLLSLDSIYASKTMVTGFKKLSRTQTGNVPLYKNLTVCCTQKFVITVFVIRVHSVQSSC
jgi:hypothetical protein